MLPWMIATPTGQRILSPRFWSYVPAIILVLEIPWLLITVLGLMFVLGDYSPQGISPHQEKVWEIFIAIPLALGLSFGLYALLWHRSVHRVDLIFLIVGTLACGVLMYRTLI